MMSKMSDYCGTSALLYCIVRKEVPVRFLSVKTSKMSIIRGSKGDILHEEITADAKTQKWEQAHVFKKMSSSSVRGGKDTRLPR